MSWLVVGLGNPGIQYERTRHNIGFKVIDALLPQANFQNGFSGFYAKTDIGDQSAVLLKPQTFMNRSGEAVQPASSFFKIPVSQMIVVHDEIDLPFGTIRLKQGGGHGGNNGLRDIIRVLGGDFVRVRFGVGRPLVKGTEDVHVLSPFSKDEDAVLSGLISVAQEAVKEIIQNGIIQAQNKIHPRG